jgi:hypothetical protein
MFILTVELMISKACNINIKLIERVNHLIAFEDVGQDRRGKAIS